MFNLKKYLREKQAVINKMLDEIITHNASGPSSRIVAAMNHSIAAGGKRLRPLLCISACEVVGGKAEKCLKTACAIEMIHTYSLIHDDLPAMDNDVLRRGKPTCHIAFDEATAILTGDALLTLGFQVLSQNNNDLSEEDVFKRLDIIHRIAVAAGYNGMIAGQMLDILSEGKKLELEELKKLHLAKTGALIEASIYSGAVLGGGTELQIAKLLEYGHNIGLAFQVTDDILNIEGDADFMGKAVGTDLDRDKSTYPALIGLSASKQFAATLIESAVKTLEMFDKEAEPLRAIARYVIERKK
ncbi:MAG: polyprenyl synthetase family protein [Deltaproteobacteria bacterium]|nr:MAG: polyprenyl synthetase family protein [Deltaproteobacteria bacterium]